MLKTTEWLAHLRDDLKHRHLKPLMPGRATGDQPTAPVIKARFDSECAAAAKFDLSRMLQYNNGETPSAGAWVAVERHPDVAARRRVLWNSLDTVQAMAPGLELKGQPGPGRIMLGSLPDPPLERRLLLRRRRLGGGRGLEGQAMGVSAAAQGLKVGDRDRLGSVPRYTWGQLAAPLRSRSSQWRMRRNCRGPKITRTCGARQREAQLQPRSDMRVGISPRQRLLSPQT